MTETADLVAEEAVIVAGIAYAYSISATYTICLAGVAAGVASLQAMGNALTGVPNDGSALSGAQPDYSSAISSLTSTIPTSDEWSGSGAEAYTSDVQSVLGFIGSLQELDDQFEAKIGENAAENEQFRYAVYAFIGVMGAAAPVCLAMTAFVPVGPEMALAAATACVATCLAGITTAITVYSTEYAAKNGNSVNSINTAESNSYLTVYNQAAALSSSLGSSTPTVPTITIPSGPPGGTGGTGGTGSVPIGYIPPIGIGTDPVSSDPVSSDPVSSAPAGSDAADAALMAGEAAGDAAGGAAEDAGTTSPVSSTAAGLMPGGLPAATTDDGAGGGLGAGVTPASLGAGGMPSTPKSPAAESEGEPGGLGGRGGSASGKGGVPAGAMGGGGMGAPPMGGSRGGTGKSQDKTKTDSLGEDEDLYTEDEEFTEGYIGNRQQVIE
jgi:hypothetical protein